MFDSHCHPTDIDDPLAVVHQALEHGVTSLLCCGYHRASNAAVLELRRRVPGLPITLGLHPWFVNEPGPQIAPMIMNEHPAAIGECGLDGEVRDPDIPPLQSQRATFEWQLDLAQRLTLPLTVHSRKAVNEVVEMAQHFPSVRGVLHAYSGSLEQIRPLLERGWMIGVGGAVTRPNARRIRKLATQIELSQLLLETDAPAIGLEDVRPPSVRPFHVVEVARVLAGLRGLDPQELAAVTDANARRMFGDQVSNRLVVGGEASG